MSKQQNAQEREFKGVWIPRDLYLNQDLSWTEKILLVEIDSLSKTNAGCFASNEYFGEFLGISTGRAANIVSDLRKKGYIIFGVFDGRNRSLTAEWREGRLHENVKVSFTKTLKEPSRKREHINIVMINKENKGKGADTPTPTPLPAENEQLSVKAKKPSPPTSAPPPAPVVPPALAESLEFMSVWSLLIDSPKWKKKSPAAISASLKILSKYHVEFAAKMATQALANGWQGVEYDGTPDAYAKWQKSRQGEPVKETFTRQGANVRNIPTYG